PQKVAGTLRAPVSAHGVCGLLSNRIPSPYDVSPPGATPVGGDEHEPADRHAEQPCGRPAGRYVPTAKDPGPFGAPRGRSQQFGGPKRFAVRTVADQLECIAHHGESD